MVLQKCGCMVVVGRDGNLWNLLCRYHTCGSLALCPQFWLVLVALGRTILSATFQQKCQHTPLPHQRRAYLASEGLAQYFSYKETFSRKRFLDVFCCIDRFSWEFDTGNSEFGVIVKCEDETLIWEEVDFIYTGLENKMTKKQIRNKVNQ